MKKLDLRDKLKEEYTIEELQKYFDEVITTSRFSRLKGQKEEEWRIVMTKEQKERYLTKYPAPYFRGCLITA